MPLSRHFYALDEVEAALSYTCTRNDLKESVFWSQEMIHSGCASEAISCLFQTWLWDKGPFALGWLLDSAAALSADEVTEADILLATDRLRSAYSLHDHSLWNILFLSLSADRVTPKTPPFAETIATTPEEMFFVRACYQGKAQSAWFMVVNHLSDFWGMVDAYVRVILSDDRIARCIQLLRQYESLLGYVDDSANEVIQCLVVLILCLSPKQRERSITMGSGHTMDSTAESFIRDLEPLVGRAAFRRYSIPVGCLYGRTQRGHTKWTESSGHQLHHIEPHLLGCPFWEDALAPYIESQMLTPDGYLPWTSDDAMEAFYDQYFPDDIPDEWTLAEKKKSHGDGVLGPQDRVTIIKYVRLHLARASRLAWNTGPVIQKRLDSSAPIALPQDRLSIFGLYATLPKKERVNEVDPLLLRPLRRELVFSS